MRPLDAATHAALQAFLNCYLRETTGWTLHPTPEPAPAGMPACPWLAVLPLPTRSARVLAGVRYRSATFRHQFVSPVRLAVDGGRTAALPFHTMVCLLLDELAGQDPRGTGEPTVLLQRVLDSVHGVATSLRLRAGEVPRLWGPQRLAYLETEQALLLGHMVHPTPKSRAELDPVQRLAYSPETAARFALRWFAVRPELVHADSATGTPAAQLAAGLPGAPAAPAGRVLLPAHPWQAEHLMADPGVADLVDSGQLEDLGRHGPPVAPTTSVRTVYRAEWPWQLKFSLHVRVTNSLRVTLPRELRRAVEAARLARTPVGAQAVSIAPTLRVVQDPAFLAVRRDGQLLDGLSVLFRDNPWPQRPGSAPDVSALTTLCQDHPSSGTSRLGAIVRQLAGSAGERGHDVGREWFGRFCEVLLVPLIRLYADLGLTFEPHQQNTLLELDGGWPRRGFVRDSQGFFHRELAHDDLCATIPQLGEASESIFPEALADQRLVYYQFVNLTLGVINALGTAGCADEPLLLGDLRRLVERERARPTRYPTTLLDRVLDDERWPCKANLRTRVHDLDELVGDISTQSVYVTVPNPLR
jgi:siderophore synthetase component